MKKRVFWILLFVAILSISVLSNKYLTNQRRILSDINHKLLSIEQSVVVQSALSNVYNGTKVDLEAIVYDGNRNPAKFRKIFTRKDQLFLFISRNNCQDCLDYLSELFWNISPDLNLKTIVTGNNYNDCINLFKEMSDSVVNVYVNLDKRLNNDICMHQFPVFAMIDSHGNIVNTFYATNKYSGETNLECIKMFQLRD